MRLHGERSLSIHGPRKRAAITAIVSAALLLTTVASFADASTAWTSRDPRVINQWNKIGVDLIVGTATIGGTARAFNYFAYQQAAVYNAVQGITRQYQLYQWSRLGPRTASPAAAAAAAAHRILVHYFPGSAATLNASYAATLAKLPLIGKAAGKRYGEAAAANIIELRAHDGLGDPSVTFNIPVGPGVWRGQGSPPQAFLAPWLSQVHPFTLNSTSQFDPGPPPDMTSAVYTADWNEVKVKGSATASLADRSAHDTETARFFFDTAAAPLQAGLRSLASRHHLDISNSARMFAAVDLSIADTLGNVWYAKVKYGFWRPISAIRLADTDGNPATMPDTTWTPLIANPPYPDWVSGLCSVYGAAGRALTRVIGSDIDLRITSPGTAVGGPLGVPITRTYHSATVMNNDAINARVFSGIHFRFADVGGTRIGVRAANWALDHNFGHN
jgi:hypothetical protein